MTDNHIAIIAYTMIGVIALFAVCMAIVVFCMTRVQGRVVHV